MLLVLLFRGLSAHAASEFSISEIAAYVFIGLVYLLTLITGLALRRGRLIHGAVWVQVGFDLMLASGVVVLTGGAESPFSFLYLMAIIGASALAGRRGALVAATGSMLAWGVTVATVVLQAKAPMSEVRLVGEALVQLLAQVLVAVLSGYVAEQLSTTGGKLTAREADLREITELQNRIVTVMPSGLITSDHDGMVSFLNPSAAAILGVEDDVRGTMPIDALLPGASRLRAAKRSEIKVATPRGDRILGLTVTPLERDGSALLIVFQDLTDLRRMESELDRIDRLAHLGRLSAQLAHEIRNPIAAMRGAGQMLAGQSLDATSQSRMAQLIVREADRLGELVDDYLKLAKPPPPRMVLARVDLVVAETIEMLRSDPSFTQVTVEESYSSVTASVDSAQLKQVVINLVRNAITATTPDGQVRVKVSAEESGSTIEVWDSAGAIDTCDIDRIFEPFYTTHAEGTGLGLSTVQSIVRAHGGRVTVQSHPERGTSFKVVLPSERAE